MPIIRSRRYWLITALTTAAAGATALVFAMRARPSLTGLSAADRGIAVSCRSKASSPRHECYRIAFKERIRTAGVAAAMASLAALANVDRAVESEGHAFAHEIGIEAYLHQKSVAETFVDCPTAFASGCGHGVIQAFLESQPAIDSGSVNALCAPYRDPGKDSWRLFQCVHGMGHGLDMMYGGDLPRALETCALLGSSWDRDSCYGGAFMENIMGAIAPHHLATELVAQHGHHSEFKRLDSADLLYPCSIMPSRYLRSCYEIQTSAIIHFQNGDIDATARVCDTAPAEMRPICYLSLGRDITARTGRNPGRTKRMCDKGTERYRPWCYFGATKALIDWRADTGPGLTFCALVDDRNGRALCFRGVGEQVASLAASHPRRDSLCAAAGQPDAINACRYGALLPGATFPGPAEN